jgi:hypothetical protein
MLHFAYEPKTLCMKNHVQKLLCNLLLAGLSLTMFAQAPANASLLCSLTVNLTVTNASAPQAHDGSITTTVANGTAPYSYQWYSGQTSANLNNLGTGRFYVTVTDVNNCTATAKARVSAPGCDSFSLGIGFIGAGPNDNSVYVILGNGTAPYTYLWSTGATDSAIYNLPSGIYCAIVTDAIGCSATPCAGESQPPTGIKEKDDLAQIEIYPNPVHDVLTVELDEQQSAILAIASLDGKVVLTHHLTTGTNAIATQGLPNGMYIYTLSSATSPPTLPQKLLINH